MFALDFDGVIADTNTLISGWIKENLGLDVPRYRCDYTQSLPYVGEANRVALGKVCYGEEYTAKTEPVPGIEAALEALAERGPVYVITARNAQQTAFTRSWLDAHDFMRYISDVIVKRDERKVDVCKRLGCRVLIEDDPRHLIPGLIPRLILLSVGLDQPAQQQDGRVVCCTWPDAVAAATA